jgi:murein DD-endopeptidase MepM/ murein hydrolase activator NlpD
LKRHRTGSVAARAAVLFCILLPCAALGVGVSTASPSSQKESAKAAFEAAKDRLASIQDEIDRVQASLAVKAREVDEAEAALDATLTDLSRVRENLRVTQERYDLIVRRLNDRAVEAFMSGPSTSLDFLLGATSMTDLSDRFEYVDAVARSDADLAQKAQSAKNVLLDQQGELQVLRSRYSDDVERARRVAAEVTAQLERATALAQEQEAVVADTGRKYRSALRAYRRSLVPVRAVGGGPLPAQYRDYFHYCPVGSPRSYWDGFGAPRYAGGYHLHKGVDMLAPTGTKIYAPFSGTAHTDFNSLGGRVVFVDGPHGRVYNAHLSAYSTNSSGPVQAGDVIGYVGDTGDAIGTPHLHFEFHPYSIPGSWPASSYGYSVIEDAINPYPLLLYACG